MKKSYHNKNFKHNKIHKFIQITFYIFPFFHHNRVRNVTTTKAAKPYTNLPRAPSGPGVGDGGVGGFGGSIGLGFDGNCPVRT